MNTALLLVALALGGVLVIAAFWHRERIRQMQSHLDAIERQRQTSQNELEATRGELAAASRQLADLALNPPLPSDHHLARHLTELSVRLVECAERLENARVISAEPLEKVSEALDKARTEERQRRFQGFKDSLIQANIRLSSHVDRMLAPCLHLLSVASALRASELTSQTGSAEVTEIERVLEKLTQEDWLEGEHRGFLHRSTEEFRFRLELNDRGKELEQRERDEQRTTAANAFNRHRLPPPTPLQKFRSLRSKGQRDAFDV